MPEKSKQKLSKRTLVALGVVGALLLTGLAVVSFSNVAKNKGPEPKAIADGGNLAASSTTVTASPETTAAAAPTTTATTIANSAYAADGSLIIRPPRPKEAEPKQVVIRTPRRCASNGEPTTGSLPGNSTEGGRRWVTVSQLSGSCDLEGGRFALRGVDTRLVMRSDASNFNAFVVDAKTGIEGTAGFPHGQCLGPCSDFYFLTDPAGQYKLRVQADGGPWQVLVQEYR